jgi:hypothetical protein
MGGAATAAGMLGGAKQPLACKDMKSDWRPAPDRPGRTDSTPCVPIPVKRACRCVSVPALGWESRGLRRVPVQELNARPPLPAVVRRSLAKHPRVCSIRISSAMLVRDRRTAARPPPSRPPAGADLPSCGAVETHSSMLKLPQISVKRNDAKTASFSRTGGPLMAAPGPDRSPQAPSDDGRGRRGHARSVVRQCSPSAITS